MEVRKILRRTMSLPEVRVSLPAGPELQPTSRPLQDDRNGSGGAQPTTGTVYLNLPAKGDTKQMPVTSRGSPPPSYTDISPQAGRPATDPNRRPPLPASDVAVTEGSRYTGPSTLSTRPARDCREEPKSEGFINLAMADVGITEDPGLHEGGQGFVPYWPTTRVGVGVVDMQPAGLMSRKSVNSPPHYDAWIGASFVGLLCCGLVPGLVALIFIWQSRFEWEQGQTNTAMKSLTKGKVALVVTLLVGVAAWGYLIYQIDASNKRPR